MRSADVAGSRGRGVDEDLLVAWGRAVTQVWDGRAWRTLRRCARPRLQITAWNPDAQGVSWGCNRLADGRLAAALDQLGLPRQRARCMAPDGAWREEGWLVPSEPGRDRRLLRRFRQLAGWRFTATGRRLCWP